tara:strand:+ start:451 stop:624 length:174 start_codon:yes stop_codon:yes gene_type:complete
MKANKSKVEYFLTAENIDLILRLHNKKAIKYVRRAKKRTAQIIHIGAKAYGDVARLQ